MIYHEKKAIKCYRTVYRICYAFVMLVMGHLRIFTGHLYGFFSEDTRTDTCHDEPILPSDVFPQGSLYRCYENILKCLSWHRQYHQKHQMR